MRLREVKADLRFRLRRLKEDYQYSASIPAFEMALDIIERFERLKAIFNSEDRRKMTLVQEEEMLREMDDIINGR